MFLQIQCNLLVTDFQMKGNKNYNVQLFFLNFNVLECICYAIIADQGMEICVHACPGKTLITSPPNELKF